MDFDGLYINEHVNELHAFDMYFCSLAAMQVHPGAGTKENKPLTLEECKQMALEMMKIRRKVATHEG